MKYRLEWLNFKFGSLGRDGQLRYRMVEFSSDQKAVRFFGAKKGAAKEKEVEILNGKRGGEVLLRIVKPGTEQVLAGELWEMV